MRKYVVYSATKPNGDFELMAIEKDEFKDPANEVAHYFMRGTKEITKHGELEIDGDCEHMADTWFSLKND